MSTEKLEIPCDLCGLKTDYMRKCYECKKCRCLRCDSTELEILELCPPEIQHPFNDVATIWLVPICSECLKKDSKEAIEKKIVDDRNKIQNGWSSFK